MSDKLYKSIADLSRGALKHQKIEKLLIGAGLIAVKLDSGKIGVSYVLRDLLPHGCDVMPYGEPLVGMKAMSAANWLVESDHAVLRSIAAAVINCGADEEAILQSSIDNPFWDMKAGDTVAMIGFIEPILRQLQDRITKPIIVFDSDLEDAPGIFPDHRQEELLPECDHVIITGTTVINKSLESILENAANAREIMLLGSSTPLFPEAFSGTGVTQLAGMIWPSSNADDIFSLISEGRGIKKISHLGKKVNVPVP